MSDDAGREGCKARGARELFAHARLFALPLLAMLAVLAAPVGFAQSIGTTPFVRETGRVNFVSTGGSLRSSATSTCAVTGSSTTALTGLPTLGTTTIVGAYLYWGGSGSLDGTVTFNGTTVTAQRTFSTTYSGVSPSLSFFGAMGGDPRTTYRDLIDG